VYLVFFYDKIGLFMTQHELDTSYLDPNLGQSDTLNLDPLTELLKWEGKRKMLSQSEIDVQRLSALEKLYPGQRVLHIAGLEDSKLFHDLLIRRPESTAIILPFVGQTEPVFVRRHQNAGIGSILDLPEDIQVIRSENVLHRLSEEQLKNFLSMAQKLPELTTMYHSVRVRGGTFMYPELTPACMAPEEWAKFMREHGWDIARTDILARPNENLPPSRLGLLLKRSI
jgi:hypothetical protein